MRKFLWLILIVPPLMAQVSNPSIVSVSVAPSGVCTSGLPNQQVVSTGTQYSCQNGTWGAIGGSGSGTVNSGTAGQLAYYAANGTAVSGNPATSDTNGNVSATSVIAPAFAPASYIAFGDSISACSTGLTITANCYVKHLGYAVNLTPTNRAASGDESADVVWRIQSGDNPAIAASPNLYTLMIGTNDADQHGVGPTTWEANYKLFHTAVLAWFSLPSKTAGSTATTSGTCSNETTFSLVTGEKCTANASTLTFSSVATTGGVLYIFYRVISTDAGTFTYAVDGGATTSVNTAPPIDFTTVNGHTSSMGVIRVTGLSAGNHSVVFTQTHSGTMSILGLGSLPALNFTALPHTVSADVPSQLDGTKSAATLAYAADARADIALLQGDTLNLVLAPVNVGIQATTAAADMANTLHPNDAGHGELYRAFAAGSRLEQANPPTWVFAQGATPTLTFTGSASVLTTSATAAESDVISTLNTAAGNALHVQKVTNSSAAAGETQYLNGTQYWFEGFIPGASTGQDFVVYDFRNSHAIMRLPTNTMPAASYGGNASGPVLLVVQTPAARKGTFVCTGGGTITISNTNEALTSDVVISLNTAGGTITTPPAMKTVTAGTGFTVLCGATDTSTYNYNILN